MDGDIPRCKTRAAAIGFDAISSYGIGGGGTVQVIQFHISMMMRTRITFLFSIRVLHLMTKFNVVNSGGMQLFKVVLK